MRVNELDHMRAVWWEVVPGVVARGYDSGRRRFFGVFAYIFYVETDGGLYARWVHTSSLIDRASRAS